MMFALLQDQHKAQLEAMAAANKQAMDAMLECMNALITGQSKAAGKVTATIPNSNTGQASNTMNRKKKVCANCGKLIFHKPQTCNELESNLSKHYPGWKSRKVDSATVWQGLGTSNNCISLVADNLVKIPANKYNNYWSPLSCPVKEQEDEEVKHTSAHHLLSAVTDFQPSKMQNKWKRTKGIDPVYWTQAAHWVLLLNTMRIVSRTPASRPRKYSCFQTRQGSEQQTRCGENLTCGPKQARWTSCQTCTQCWSACPRSQTWTMLQCLTKKRPEYMTLQLPLYRQQKTTSLLHHAARTPDCGN